MVNKSNLRNCLGISTCLLAVAGLAQAATTTVGPVAGYDFSTIQAGIDAAVDGDTVLVAPDEYIITEPITFQGKAITVRSEAGPDETVIRMGTLADPERGSVVVFENSETTASVLEGFTITGGKGIFVPSDDEWGGGGILFVASSGTVRNCAIVQNTTIWGGGVCCFHPCSVTLIGCTIAENIVGEDGGGVFTWDGCSITLTNCIIRGNSTTGVEVTGGGVACSVNSSITMTDCIISENLSADAGGGVACWQGSLILSRCAIVDNMGQDYFGGGVYVGHGSATLTNCIIARNTAPRGGGGVACSYPEASLAINNCTIWGNSAGIEWGGGGVLCRRASATVTNSIIWGNTARKGSEISVEDPASTLTIAYSNVAGGQTGVSVEGSCTLNWGTGNINVDPCFADPNNEDYHLKSQAGRYDPNTDTWTMDDVTSSCIDVGDPNSDWTAELWPHGIRTNMGAYGGILQASRSLSEAGNIADLNRDGVVDSVDVCKMVDHWHTDEPLCDISPTPFGDGIVDAQDLTILSEHLFEDTNDPTLIAHWALDEIEGDIAQDSINNNDGTVHGNPAWQSDAGMLDGALQLDGIDDYVSTPRVLNPSYGKFSVFVWVKGSAPGHVILSQVSGANWLRMGPSDGNLITELKGASRAPSPLQSQTNITDGEWHRIGFVWDGSYRTLYVDGIAVAEDTQDGLESSEGGLYLGCGKSMEHGTFWSGLIDDVRIYNRAVRP